MSECLLCRMIGQIHRSFGKLEPKDIALYQAHLYYDHHIPKWRPISICRLAELAEEPDGMSSDFDERGPESRLEDKKGTGGELTESSYFASFSGASRLFSSSEFPKPVVTNAESVRSFARRWIRGLE